MKKQSVKTLICVAILLCTFSVQGQEGKFIFKQGENGYQCFRIPAIVKTTKGTLLAFAEGRKKGCSDTGDIDLLLKRSFDGGASWSEIIMVWDDKGNTCGNPAPVVDETTGHIVLLSTWNLGEDQEKQIINGTSKDTRRVFVLKSVDEGQSWSDPKEITSDVKKDNWTWYATGPCNGIQLKSKKYKNRLVIPCDFIEAGTKKHFSHSIYSDDRGETWKLGGVTESDQVNECTVAELSNGDLMLNMRNYSPLRVRQVAISKDGGQSWEKQKEELALEEPICQGSLIAFKSKKGKYILAFSNPANPKGRTNMTVKLSYDNGKTWKQKQLVYEGPSAYSNLVILPNGNIACLYEGGVKSAYESIVFKELSFENFK